MKSDDITKIAEGLKDIGKIKLIEGASAEEISSFEEKNNIMLPIKYKDWLEYSDGGELFLPAGVQLYGVEHKPTIDISDNDRPSDKYLVIGSLASGDPILCEKDGETISIYNHEVGRIEDDETYEDFAEFLKDLKNILGIGE